MGLHVINRQGEREGVRFDAILEKLNKLAVGLNTDWVDTGLVTKNVVEGLYDGVSTREVDKLAAETAASFAANHPDYGMLAAKISVENLHRDTKEKFSDVITDLRE